MKVFDLVVMNKGKDQKTYYNNVGVMFVTDKGPMIKLHLLDKTIYARPRGEKQQPAPPPQTNPVNQNPAPEYFGGDDIQF